MKRFLIAAIAAASTAIAGCAGTSQFISDHEVLAQAGVQYAAAKFVRSAGDTDAQAQRKARIHAVAEEVRAIAGDSSATVALLRAAVEAKLPADLKAEDRILVGLLINAVVQELEKRVGEGILNPEQQLALTLVLEWVEQGADLV